MKNSSIRNTATFVALALSAAAAHAGTETTGALMPQAEPAPFSGSLSAGYDNRYIFRGLWFGNDTVWTNLEVSKEIAPGWTVAANAFYTDVMDDSLSYSEANLGANITYSSDYGDVTLGTTFYRFFDGFAGNNIVGTPFGQKDATEVYLTLSKELYWGVTGTLTGAYDFRIDGSYLEAGLSKSWELTDSIGLETAVAVGYSLDDYYTNFAPFAVEDGEGFTHTLVSVSLPIEVTETVTFTPHVSANFSHESRDGLNPASILDETVFFGANVSVSF